MQGIQNPTYLTTGINIAGIGAGIGGSITHGAGGGGNGVGKAAGLTPSDTHNPVAGGAQCR